MKITKALVKEFEAEQAEYGTKVALHNVIWNLAAQLLRDLGIERISTK
jgi:hypothetical protein